MTGLHPEFGSRGGGDIVDDAVEPFFDHRGSEIDEQSDGDRSGLFC